MSEPACPTGYHQVMPGDPADLAAQLWVDCAQTCGNPSTAPTREDGQPSRSGQQAPAAPGETSPERVEVTTLATVQPERVEWLWPDRLPAGKLITLDGDPSLGKSTLALDIAAHITTGSPWPDATHCPTGDVVILSAEDGLADTIRPRLDAAGADPRRVHALTGITTGDGDGGSYSRALTLADITHISRAVENTGARLLIVDVLMAYLPGKVDSHRDQDVRTVLARLAALGESTGCCILLLRHLNKTGGGSAVYRGGGSIGIIGAARGGFTVGRDPDDDTRMVLSSTKSNLAQTPASLTYRLESAPDSHVAHIVWGGESTHTADSLLSSEDGEDRSERDEAAEWIRSYLTDLGGSAPAKDVLKAGRAAGFTSDDVLKKARRRVKATTKRVGFGKGSEMHWSIDAP